MTRRTTVELDEELLARAKRALGAGTTRATIEQALRLATATAEDDRARRAERQRAYLERVDSQMDRAVLRSEEMWR